MNIVFFNKSTKFHNSKFIGLLLIILLIHEVLPAQKLFTREIGIQSDNDTYVSLSEDKYYTNGLMFFYRFIPNQSKPDIEKVVVEFRLGSKMYTPSSANKPDITDHDRPFAGYLFANAQISKFYKNESMFRLSGQVGILGPASGVGAFQELMHNFIGWYSVKGWEHQISNALGLNISGMYSLKLTNYLSKQADINLYSLANLGTFQTNFAIGFWNRFSFIQLNEVYESNLFGASIVKDRKVKSDRKGDLFFFFKPQLEYHLYDASIQGGLFNDKSPLTFDIEPFQFTFEFGLMFQFERANIWYSVTLQSKDVKNDLVERYAWGSLKLSWML